MLQQILLFSLYKTFQISIKPWIYSCYFQNNKFPIRKIFFLFQKLTARSGSFNGELCSMRRCFLASNCDFRLFIVCSLLSIWSSRVCRVPISRSRSLRNRWLSFCKEFSWKEKRQLIILTVKTVSLRLTLFLTDHCTHNHKEVYLVIITTNTPITQ